MPWIDLGDVPRPPNLAETPEAQAPIIDSPDQGASAETANQPAFSEPETGQQPEPHPVEAPPEEAAAPANPFVVSEEPGLPGVAATPPTAPETPQQALEQAIASGDKHRVISALAAIGVKTDDDLLARILIPPGYKLEPIQADDQATNS